jgi:pimeloyl-ACP methyl ester carboxylesterase
MTQFVLVHGSFHGAWAWAEVARRLKARGHRVEAVDLPGSGADPTPHDHVTGQSYVDRICRTIDERGEPVVLVAHSMAGVVASLVAENRADKLVRVVYLCAFMLPSGQTLSGFLDENEGLIEEELVLKNISVSPDGRVASFDTRAAADIFYNSCSPADARWAAAQLRPQPLAIYGERLVLTDEQFGRVPRTYIETLRDQAVQLPFQRKMQADLPCASTVSLDTDHSPFLSAPNDLVEALVSDQGGLGPSPLDRAHG